MFRIAGAADIVLVLGRVIEKYRAKHPKLGFLPIAVPDADIGMVMDMDTLEPLDVIEVDPW